MIGDEIATQVTDALNRDFPNARKPLEFRPVPVDQKTGTLSEQWNRVREIESQLLERMRRERLAVMADYAKRKLDLDAEFAERLSVLDALAQRMR